MLVANIKIWKSHLNIREGSDYLLVWEYMTLCIFRCHLLCLQTRSMTYIVLHLNDWCNGNVV